MGGTTVECPKCGGTEGVSVWRNYDKLTKEEKERIFQTKVKPLMDKTFYADAEAVKNWRRRAEKWRQEYEVSSDS